jgi:hypothetical protein
MSHEKQHEKLKVVVHFVAATKPFRDDDADRAETVGHLKDRVLAAFGLQEAGTVYTLHHGNDPLENPLLTIGAVAGDKPVLQLQLVQQLVQG